MADRTSAAHGGEAARVLVLEGDDLVRRLIASELAQLGYPAVETGDPREAWRLLHGEPRVDLLITGATLRRNLDGAGLALEVRHAHPRTAVIVVSGYVEPTLEANLLREGVQVLSKPFRLRELARKVRAALASRLS
ncbi:MAG: response regulator [Rhodospirillaceae bacterium]|nr:response regulator [Rhodospirillaceae bacterium]